MKLEHAEQLPGFIKRNSENTNRHCAADEKSIIYRFLAFPLAAFSLFHLASLLIQAPSGRGALVSAGILPSWRPWVLHCLRKPAISGNRCKNDPPLYAEQNQKSDILSEERKSAYTRLIAEEPSAMKSFIEFLTEEDRKRNALLKRADARSALLSFKHRVVLIVI